MLSQSLVKQLFWHFGNHILILKGGMPSRIEPQMCMPEEVIRVSKAVMRCHLRVWIRHALRNAESRRSNLVLDLAFRCAWIRLWRLQLELHRRNGDVICVEELKLQIIATRRCCLKMRFGLALAGVEFHLLELLDLAAELCHRPALSWLVRIILILLSFIDRHRGGGGTAS